MIEIQKFIQRNSRRLLATSALGLALLVVLTVGSHGPQGYGWEVISPIPADEKLTSQNIALVRIDLGTLSSEYFGKVDSVVGKFTTHELLAGALLSSRDLTVTPSQHGVALLPIGLLASDIPVDIEPGNFVDIYVIPKDVGTSPALVVSRVEVAQLDVHSRSLGGSVNISLNVTPTQAILVIEAESQGRLVVATDAI